MKDYKISLQQIDLMKHCIGFSSQSVKGRKNPKYEAYRNYFTTSGVDEEWEDLVNQGLSTKREHKRGCGHNPQIYFVSQDGLDFLSDVLSVKITEKD